MEASEQTRFDALFAQPLRALKLQGKAEATVDGYARAVRRAAGYFDRCPDQRSSEEFKNYFSSAAVCSCFISMFWDVSGPGSHWRYRRWPLPSPHPQWQGP